MATVRNKILTIYFTLVALVTYSADQLSDALLPVESYGDRLVMLAENTLKCGV